MTTLIGIFVGYYLFTLIFMYGLHNNRLMSIILLILLCWIEFPIFLSYTFCKFRVYIDNMNDICDALNDIMKKHEENKDNNK